MRVSFMRPPCARFERVDCRPSSHESSACRRRRSGLGCARRISPRPGRDTRARRFSDGRSGNTRISTNWSHGCRRAIFALRLPFDRSARDRWTIKDALAHITFWKADVARKALGIRPPAKDRKAMSSDANHFVYLRWRDRSAKDVVAWHRQVQEDLLAALRAAPAKWFTSKNPASWWPPNVDHHSAQHRRDIERALERARPR